MVWKLAWRSGRGRLEGSGIPEDALGASPRKDWQLYYSAEVNRSARIQRLVLYTGSFCFAPLAFPNCASPPFLLYRLCRLPMPYHIILNPWCMHVIRGSLDIGEQHNMQNFSNIVSSLGYTPHAHFSPPLPFPLFFFGSVVPAASPFFCASCP